MLCLNVVIVKNQIILTEEKRVDWVHPGQNLDPGSGSDMMKGFINLKLIPNNKYQRRIITEAHWTLKNTEVEKVEIWNDLRKQSNMSTQRLIP